MNTHSGRLVLPGNWGVPSPMDIAIGLSRQPRYAGATAGWWSVLHHIYVGDCMLRRLGAEDARPWWLFHDAEESIVGDTPTTWKCTEQAALGDRLRRRICEEYLGHEECYDPEVDKLVRLVDRAALLAEVKMDLAPPGVGRDSGILDLEETLTPAMCGPANVADDVYRARHWAPGPYISGRPDNHGLIRWFLVTMRSLVVRPEAVPVPHVARSTPQPTGATE